MRVGVGERPQPLVLLLSRRIPTYPQSYQRERLTMVLLTLMVAVVLSKMVGTYYSGNLFLE